MLRNNMKCGVDLGVAELTIDGLRRPSLSLIRYSLKSDNSHIV